MDITRRAIISAACGFVLAMGLVVILVPATAPLASYFSPSVQKFIPVLVFVLSLLAVTPLIARRLNRLDGMKKILGWTFMGLGAEFLAFPLSLLGVIKSAQSLGIVLVMTAVFAYSLVFGGLVGLILIAIGILLIKSK